MTRVWRFMQLENGWLVPTILLIMVLLPVFSMNDAQWVDRTQDLLPVALLGAVLGVGFAKSRLNRFLAVPLGILSGAGILYVWSGELIPPLSFVFDRIGAFPAWLSLALRHETVAINPLRPVITAILDRNDLMAGRLWDWIVVGTEGGYSSDNFVFFFLLALLTVAITFYSAWCLYRYRNALVAVMPIGLTLMVNSFLSNRGMSWIIIYVVLTLVLLMAANLASLQRFWQKKDIDYSTEINFDLTVFTMQVSAVLAFAALLMPSLKANPVATTYWIYVSQPWGQVETLFNRLFAGVNNPNPDLGTGSKGAFVLGGSFDRGESSPDYMYISTDEYIVSPEEAESLGEPGLGGAPSHYWRGETWDFYTGHGWDHGQKVAVDRAASDPITPFVIPGAYTITENVEILSPRADIMYATNQPISSSQPYRLMTLGPSDFSAIYLRRTPLSSVKYTITSTIPYLGVEDLRRDSTAYPDWVQEFYLQLPKGLPERVTELAKQLTITSTTPYDKAIAIQDYLRKLPYDPQIQLPSSGSFDAVDWFLFTQKGYCDYFGTVMAIMLRTVGVPARLATGYLPGYYDYGRARYIVAEKDGHAWTEVYFPEFGWIDFEPTPGLAPIVRPSGSLLTNEPFPLSSITASLVKAPWWTNIRLPFSLSFLRAVPIILGVLIVLGLLWSLWPLLERRLATSSFIMTIYGRMCRYAAWAGLIKPLASTPYEYARSLSDAVAGAPPGILRWRRPAQVAEDNSAQHIATISNAFVEMRYSPHQATDETRAQVVTAWQAVKGRIWPMIARTTLRRIFRRG
jgi:transglutaminase-like putative cysteine protease